MQCILGKFRGIGQLRSQEKRFWFTETESTFSAWEFSAYFLSKRYTVHVVAIVPIVSQSSSPLSQSYCKSPPCSDGSAFQNHTERMRKKLANQKQQQVDDEDDRIAKAVAERERKREVSCFFVCLFVALHA